MRRNEIILLAKKAADAWRNTDTYHQAAQIIDMLISELEDAKKERYIWFTPLNDWAKVTPFGVLFFGSEELMTWETLCEEWGGIGSKPTAACRRERSTPDGLRKACG